VLACLAGVGAAVLGGALVFWQPGEPYKSLQAGMATDGWADDAPGGTW
jgi:hypothetical protein